MTHTNKHTDRNTQTTAQVHKQDSLILAIDWDLIKTAVIIADKPVQAETRNVVIGWFVRKWRIQGIFSLTVFLGDFKYHV